MNELQIFQYGNKSVRTVQHKGGTWWVLKDVCDILEIAQPTRVAERLDKDEVSQTHITDSLGRNQETYIINESGLYNVILRSDKPEAKPFRKWVTSEVLPSIHKHGVYATAETAERLMNDPDFMIKTFQALKEEREQRQALEVKAIQNAPKVLFADAVSTANTEILIGELAKLLKQNGIDTGEKRLFSWLRDNGYLIKRFGTDYNAPTQKSMELGLFRVKETAITHGDGHVIVSKTTKVTGKGQQYFVGKFLGA